MDEKKKKVMGSKSAAISNRVDCLFYLHLSIWHDLEVKLSRKKLKKESKGGPS